MNLNAFAERFVRSIKSECLNRMIFIGQASLQHAISNFMAHYHRERNHQGLGNELIEGAFAVNKVGRIRSGSRRRRIPNSATSRPASARSTSTSSATVST